jgi:hypothetical protein
MLPLTDVRDAFDYGVRDDLDAGFTLVPELPDHAKSGKPATPCLAVDTDRERRTKRRRSAPHGNKQTVERFPARDTALDRIVTHALIVACGLALNHAVSGCLKLYFENHYVGTFNQACVLLSYPILLVLAAWTFKTRK